MKKLAKLSALADDERSAKRVAPTSIGTTTRYYDSTLLYYTNDPLKETANSWQPSFSSLEAPASLAKPSST